MAHAQRILNSVAVTLFAAPVDDQGGAKKCQLAKVFCENIGADVERLKDFFQPWLVSCCTS